MWTVWRDFCRISLELVEAIPEDVVDLRHAFLDHPIEPTQLVVRLSDFALDAATRLSSSGARSPRRMLIEARISVSRCGCSSRSIRWPVTSVSSLTIGMERPWHASLPCRAQVEHV